MVSPEDYFEVKNYLLLVLDSEYSSHNMDTQYLQLNSHFLTLGPGGKQKHQFFSKGKFLLHLKGCPRNFK